MPQKNAIAVVIPAAQLTVITGLITQLRTAIAPYIHALTPEEIKGIAKMGDKTVAFVDKVKDYMVSNPEFVPANLINVADFNVDVNAVNVLSPVSKSINQIAGDLEDTLMLCGNEALIPALIYYHNVKFNASNGVASAKTIHEDLKKRFPGRGKSKKSTPTG